jgi:DNA-binding CsgD family transcriptional regulator
MKKSIIGGIFMARSYRHISEYEEEILRLKAEGKTKREIGNRLGFSYEQIHNFISRYNEKQRKIAAGIVIKKKGRPPRDCQVSEEDKVAQLRYIIDRKDAKIKSLEMENELMRDFLSLTERK